MTPERFAELCRQGVLGEPTLLGAVPFEALQPAEQREARERFAALLQGRDAQRTLRAAEVYPVIPAGG